MLVKNVAFNRFLIVVGFMLSASFCAYADQTKCEATDVFYNGVAQKATSVLSAAAPKLEQYNNHVKTALKDPNSPCYLLNTQVSQSSSTPYSWSGFDLSGATQAGAQSEEIKKLISGMDLSNIDTNFSAYEYKNSARIAAANIKLKRSANPEDTQKIQNDLRIFQQCKVELFNLQQEQSSIKDLRNNASLYLTTLSSPKSTTCTCDESGTLKTCSSISETPQEVSAKDQACKNLNEFAQDTAFCPTCTIFERILMADQKLAKGAFGVLAEGFTKILSIAFLIFLAYQTLVLVSTPSKQSISKYLTTLTIQAFKVLIAILILANPQFLYDLALRPIIEGGIDFGLALTKGSQADILAAGAKYTKFDTSNSLLTAPFLQKMVGAADVFNKQAALMPAMGQALVCNSWENLSWNIIPDIETLLEGILIIIFGYIISLSVGFYLLDLTLELGFFCCLLPFLVTCWPFKLTSNYVKVGWNIFLHIFFNFVMLGVIITAINAISKRAIAPEGDIKILLNALNTNNYDQLKELMDVGGVQMLMLIICCYICLKLLRDVNSLANKFAGGAGFNISPAIGGLAASAVFAYGKGGSAMLFKGLARGANAVGEVGKATGATGAIKAGADALGYSKMKNYFSEKGTQGKQFINKTLGSMGVGANAVERGGRQDKIGETGGNSINSSNKEGAEKS